MHIIQIAHHLLICSLILLFHSSTLLAADSRTCEIDQENSEVVIRVYKEGKLSAFGDNHLISTSYLEGRLSYDQNTPEESSILLSVPTQSLIVNDPELRANAEAAFNSKVSSLNRRITRKSMLGKKVLHAKKYPFINIRSIQLPERLSGKASMEVTLRDTTRPENVSMQTQFHNETLSITGHLQLKQSDYGIQPFSIMFGGIRVKDALQLNFNILSNCAPS